MPNTNKFTGNSNKLDSINHLFTFFSGDANEITLKDLKPATEYHLKYLNILCRNAFSMPFCFRVCACIDSCKGEYTNPTPFTTEQCEPDQPSQPKLLGSRLKNALTLKWTATPDNGSKILNYILEYDEVNFDKKNNNN